MATRNRYLQLLSQRLERVRRAARFVYRDDPAKTVEVASEYQRIRRITAKRAATKKANGGTAPAPEAPAPAPTGGQPQ